MSPNVSISNDSSEYSDHQVEVQSITSQSTEKNGNVVEQCDAVVDSGEQVDEENDKEVNDYSFKNWFLKGKRSRTNSNVNLEEAIESVVSASKPEINSTDLKNSASFRRSFRSLFKRETEPITIDNEKSIISEVEEVEDSKIDPPSIEKEQLVDEHQPNRFWRSWRHSHRHGSASDLSSVRDFEEDENVKTLRKSQSREELILSNEAKRKRNMKKLELELINASPSKTEKVLSDTSPSPINNFIDSNAKEQPQYEISSSSSSIERAAAIKDRLGSIFSTESADASKEEISPLTPLEDDVLEGAYKHVFETPREYSSFTSNFDSLFIDRKSHVYSTISEILKLVDGSDTTILNQDSPKELTISQVTDEVLKFVKMKIDIESKLMETKKALEEEVKLSDRKLKTIETKQFMSEEKLKILEVQLKTQINAKESILEKVSLLNDKLLELELPSDITDAENPNSYSPDTKMSDFSLETVLNNASSNPELMKNFDSLSNLINKCKNLKNKYRNIKMDNAQLVKEYEELTRSYNELFKSNEELQTKIKNNEERLQSSNKSKEVNIDSTKLLCAETNISNLKIANKRLTADYQRERAKLLDLRSKEKQRERYLQVYETYRSESLQFMVYLMHSFRSFISNDTLDEYDSYIKALNNFSYTKDHYSNEEIDNKLNDFVNKLTEFFHNVAKAKFVDQLMAKHVSYMLSNDFLSKQLYGLRKQNTDYEQFAKHLLEELNTLKSNPPGNINKTQSQSH
ncbi:hypothetical protein Kpol_1053p37 [Vanderwaltozyma polyspora DSM 70294]|uniref:Uncharacterized protein n=1 Tax=Vanderwaltozyma polyspora (strain ATCC 22028 / DSM 70294 / BCRC 21397 / CBS 2163 / NBRC 10782 / NRRL Y-8283 / UCD 57-17) TaxID=436907 RepID=A7TN81_VANPO|nr:uncharacterized protein Kpol_1053p37 [Vanderwaltozyma polyspora DSM 70294]EDO16299.1 hypothetical protein Kpol_1053p37 [Vanderwaltozyma polyspora DSM 70294]